MKSIIEKELVTFSGQTFSETKQAYKYIRDMLERIYEEGVHDGFYEAIDKIKAGVSAK